MQGRTDDEGHFYLHETHGSPWWSIEVALDDAGLTPLLPARKRTLPGDWQQGLLGATFILDRTLATGR